MLQTPQIHREERNDVLGPAPVGRRRTAGTSRDDHQALTPGDHAEVFRLPSRPASWNPSGTRSPHCCPPARSTIPLAATASASPTASSSTSSSRSSSLAAATAASPTTPARPPRSGAAGDEWIALGVVDQLHRLALAAYDRIPADGAPGGGWLHHQGALRWPGRRAQPGRSPQAGPQALAGDRGWRGASDGGAGPGQPPQATGCWQRPWMPLPPPSLSRLVPCQSGQWCSWTPAMTRAAGTRSPTAAWSAGSPPVGCQRRSRLAAAG